MGLFQTTAISPCLLEWLSPYQIPEWNYIEAEKDSTVYQWSLFTYILVFSSELSFEAKIITTLWRFCRNAFYYVLFIYEYNRYLIWQSRNSRTYISTKHSCVHLIYSIYQNNFKCNFTYLNAKMISMRKSILCREDLLVPFGAPFPNTPIIQTHWLLNKEPSCFQPSVISYYRIL